MAIQFVGRSAGVHDWYGSTDDIPLPAGVQPGDLLLYNHTWSNGWWGSWWWQNGIEPEAPAGYTLLGRDQQSDRLDDPYIGGYYLNNWGYDYQWGRHLCAYRIADGTEQPLKAQDNWWYNNYWFGGPRYGYGFSWGGWFGWWFSSSITAWRGVTKPLGWVGDFSERVTYNDQSGNWVFQHDGLALPSRGHVIFSVDSFDNWWWNYNQPPNLIPAPGFQVDSNEQDYPYYNYATHLWGHSLSPQSGTIHPYVNAQDVNFRSDFASWWGQAVTVNLKDSGALLL